MGTFVKFLFVIVYTNTVHRASNAIKVATFPWHTTGHGTLQHWASCMRIARHGALHRDPFALEQLAVTVDLSLKAQAAHAKKVN
jgi:hypothetical protein